MSFLHWKGNNKKVYLYTHAADAHAITQKLQHITIHQRFITKQYQQTVFYIDNKKKLSTK